MRCGLLVEKPKHLTGPTLLEMSGNACQELAQRLISIGAANARLLSRLVSADGKNVLP
jgi:hypothetical protein